MSIFYTILFSVPVLAVLWWIWAHLRLQHLPRGRWWQVAIAAFSITFLISYAWMIYSRWDGTAWTPHPWLLAMLMIWGMIFLPMLAVPSMIGWSIWRAGRWCERRLRRGQFRKRDEAQEELAPETCMTRRQMISAAIVAFPMIATLGTTAYSLPQKRRFRVRDFDLHLRDLPEALDGLRIVQISDAHVGKFTRGEILDRIAQTSNRLEPDIVVLTGDLIDHTVNDLPEAIGMIHGLTPRDGLVCIEGNHDLFDGREAFVHGVRSAGIPLLLDEARTVRVRGYPVQFLGIKWHFRGNPIEPHVHRVMSLRDPHAFPILLAHHPHAFDVAARHGLPLTLAGHTHGGQLMLNEQLGAGPAIFKYWSGHYAQGEHHLIVSNGVGNWFPLRTNAPAEIVVITLRRRS